MNLADRLQSILDDLPTDWSEASLVLTVVDRTLADRAALVLSSLTPGRTGEIFRLRLSPGGGAAPSVEATKKALDRLDDEGIDARLALSGGLREDSQPAPEHARTGLATSWDGAVAGFPGDWSDAYLGVVLASTDDIDRAALLLGPANPFLIEGDRPSFRFRAARRFGYGVAPMMARRVLARLDEDGILGRLEVLRVLSDSHPVHTQGPVWHEQGRTI